MLLSSEPFRGNRILRVDTHSKRKLYYNNIIIFIHHSMMNRNAFILDFWKPLDDKIPPHCMHHQSWKLCGEVCLCPVRSYHIFIIDNPWMLAIASFKVFLFRIWKRYKSEPFPIQYITLGQFTPRSPTDGYRMSPIGDLIGKFWQWSLLAHVLMSLLPLSWNP